MVKWVQPSIFGNSLAFISRKRKVVKTGGKTFRTGRTRGAAAPLGITFLGQRGARSKVSRKRAG